MVSAIAYNLGIAILQPFPMRRRGAIWSSFLAEAPSSPLCDDYLMPARLQANRDNDVLMWFSHGLASLESFAVFFLTFIFVEENE